MRWNAAVVSWLCLAACGSGRLSDLVDPALELSLHPGGSPTIVLTVAQAPRSDCAPVSGVTATVAGIQLTQKSSGAAGCNALAFSADVPIVSLATADAVDVLVKRDRESLSMTAVAPCAARHLDLLDPDGGVLRPNDPVLLHWREPVVNQVQSVVLAGGTPDAPWTVPIDQASLSISEREIAFTLPDPGHTGPALLSVRGAFTPPASPCEATSCAVSCDLEQVSAGTSVQLSP